MCMTLYLPASLLKDLKQNGVLYSIIYVIPAPFYVAICLVFCT